MATFRHRTVARFHLGRFKFEGGYLRLGGKNEAADKEEFLDLLSRQETREQNAIVEINETAERNLEQPVNMGDRVIRGAQDTGGIKTPVKGEGQSAIQAEIEAMRAKYAEDVKAEAARIVADRELQEAKAKEQTVLAEAALNVSNQQRGEQERIEQLLNDQNKPKTPNTLSPAELADNEINKEVAEKPDPNQPLGQAGPGGAVDLAEDVAAPVKKPTSLSERLKK